MSVKIARTASPSNWMHGDVTSYNAGTGALVVNVLDILGSGTFTDWTVTLSAPNLSFATDVEVKALTEAAKVISPATLAELVPALGTANYKQFMNAAGTAPEWAKGIYIGTFSRTLTDAGAPTDVAYTGVGFKGSLLRIFGSKSGSFSGTVSGMSDGTKQYCEYQYTDEGIYVSTTYCALASDMAGNQTAVLKSFDSDGFTLTWTKSSSPTGTATFIYIVYR
jgi:hypothetical protein